MPCVVTRDSTLARTISVKLDWRIEEFTKLTRLFENGQALKSRQFGSPTVRHILWQLVVYPNGDVKENEKFVSIFLRQSQDGLEPIYADFKVYALDKLGVKMMVGEDVNEITDDLGWPNVLQENMKSACTTEGCLNLICEVDFIPPGVKFSADSGDKEELTNCPNKFGYLLQTGLFSDCKFRVGDRTLASHRNILGMHSQVFRSMFEAEGMVEAEQGVIDITDSYYEPVHAMLQFMYNGTVEQVDKCPEEVLALAEKYGVLELKNVCERLLCKSITEKTISRTVTVADAFNAKIMKDACIEFLSNHHKKVLKSGEWAKLRKEYPSLANEMLEIILTGPASRQPRIKKVKLG